MIPRHLGDFAAADAVRTRVTHVPDEHLALLGAEESPHHGGPHAVAFARAHALLDDLAIGEADTGEQPVLFFTQASVEVEGPRHVIGCRSFEEIDDSIGGKAAGNVTRTMS